MARDPPASDLDWRPESSPAAVIHRRNIMNRRDFTLSALSSPLLLSGVAGSVVTTTATAADAQSAAAALKQAAVFMDDVVSFRGGYVWSVSPDLTQRFGEMEAKPTMCWIQPPG